MARCASPGPGGYRCADQLAHPGPAHTEGDDSWPLYAQERTALAIVDRLGFTGDTRVRVYAVTLEQLNREDEARGDAGPDADQLHDEEAARATVRQAEVKREHMARRAAEAVDRGDSAAEAYWARRLAEADGQLHQLRAETEEPRAAAEAGDV